MNPHSESLKRQLFHKLGGLGEKHPYFSFETIKKHAHETWPELKVDTLRHYLSEAAGRGFLHDAGRGWYSSLVEPPQWSTEPVEPLRSELGRRFPFLPHYLWSTLQFNTWMYHLIGKPTIFIQVDSDGLEDVAAWLRQQGWNVLVNPTAKTGKDFIPGDRSVILRGILRSFDPETEPRIETALVDLLLENSRLHLMDEGELQEMSRNLLKTNRIDLGSLIARLRDHKKALPDLVGESGLSIIAEITTNSEIMDKI